MPKRYYCAFYNIPLGLASGLPAGVTAAVLIYLLCWIIIREFESR